MLLEERRKQLFKQGYRIVGRHSAVKICEWCRKALVNKGVCYKGTFYGIKSWRCVQMTPALDVCNLRCKWCWRDISHAQKKFSGTIDSPQKIIDGCIVEQKKLLSGFPGFEGTNMQRFKEAMQPLHFAISLEGEPCLYPKLPQLVDEINAHGITTFVVSNGTVPNMVKKLLKHQPTQMYVTLPAPNEEIFQATCSPLEKNLWSSIQKSLSMLNKFERSTIRLTLVKDVNMLNPEEYAKLIKKASPDFVEFKAYMFVGFSRKRLQEKNMPLHTEVKEFAEKVNKHLNYKLVDESKPSRVVLLWNEKTPLKIKFKE